MTDEEAELAVEAPVAAVPVALGTLPEGGAAAPSMAVAQGPKNSDNQFLHHTHFATASSLSFLRILKKSTNANPFPDSHQYPEIATFLSSLSVFLTISNSRSRNLPAWNAVSVYSVLFICTATEISTPTVTPVIRSTQLMSTPTQRISPTIPRLRSFASRSHSQFTQRKIHRYPPHRSGEQL